MSKNTNYKQYWGCISPIVHKTFEDKNLRSQFCFGILFLMIGIITAGATPLFLKKIVEIFSAPEMGSITFVLLSYGFIWMVSQASSLYEIIGWVPQETYLLNDTIQNNIHFVRPGTVLKDIEYALKSPCLFNFVNCLYNGIQSVVGDRGLKLSGGEKQRLALARLFLKKPKICIFDESTSSLDKNTEFTIQNNIETFLPGMTKIIITHRPVIVENADQIITLVKNRIFCKTELNKSIKLKR
ncbi:MAG TPA: ATP-binding cassette domain-containing protein [Alphaproteobacteria bacterium]|nr:ATP-binding cassette domain-containing protein [Alphaproteobacteria bacterium]